MSCNDSAGFPHASLVVNVSSQQPDVLMFLDDQIPCETRHPFR